MTSGVRRRGLVALVTFGAVLLTVSIFTQSLVKDKTLNLSPYTEFKRRDIIDNINISNNNNNYNINNNNEQIFHGSFGKNGFLKPTNEELLPVNLTNILSASLNSSSSKLFPQSSSVLTEDMMTVYSSFLSRRLLHGNDQENNNYLIQQLKYSDDIIRESQRLHFNILGDLLKRYRYAMLFDIAAFENKGDPCITAGEIYFLRRMNIEVVYYCSFSACTQKNIDTARIKANEYGPQKLIILIHGGGNIIGYAANDLLRFQLLTKFKGYEMMVFPQSIWVRTYQNPHVHRAMLNYCCNKNLTLVLRDKQSYDIAKKIFKGSTRLLMLPDMAFQIGRMERFMSPVFDIIWLKRKDAETPGYTEMAKVPEDLRVHISDWWKWSTPSAGSSLEKAFYIATNGFFFLQRGRVIITDRLHGHILATLMDIPHVLIDNRAKKLSAYHNSWTKSLENTVITDKPSEALDLAIGLLKKYNNTLPPIVPFLNLNEYFAPPRLGQPIIHYP